MKTAISIPNPLFDRVERLSKEHGMNRSQFFATAAARYADELESGSVTHAINSVLDLAGSADVGDFTQAAARNTLGDAW
jgi:metal-responsive CopG/Arc/MetJ family transcriptional regulator